MSVKPMVITVVIVALAVLGYVQLSERADEAASVSASDADDARLRSVAFRQQILHASDLVAGMAEAVRKQDQQAIEQWQQKAVDVAQAAGLSASDIDFIRSEKGREYLIFHARRNLFNQEFEQRYYGLQDIESLQQKYPEAQDLFADAEQLIAARDAIIVDIAAELSNQTPPDDVAIEKAKTLWQERFKQTTFAPTEASQPNQD
ncbi:MAG: hypothetical protein HWE26_16910 [Alteromonadaceae bacterium]|nr:hypothetical protein [Alteromonadaceae bacterium]